MFSNCLSKVTLQKNCQPLRGFPLPTENFSLQNFLRQKCEAFLASGFPLLHFAQRKIQQKLSASFRGFPLPAENFSLQNFLRQKCEAFLASGFPSGGSSLRSKVMRGAAYNAKPIFDCLNIFDKKFQKIKGRNLFSNCLSKVALRKKNCQPLRGFPLFLGGGSCP